MRTRSAVLVVVLVGLACCRSVSTDRPLTPTKEPVTPAKTTLQNVSPVAPAPKEPKAAAGPSTGLTPRQPPIGSKSTARERAQAVIDGWVIFDRDAGDVLCAIDRPDNGEVWVFLPSRYTYNSDETNVLYAKQGKPTRSAAVEELRERFAELHVLGSQVPLAQVTWPPEGSTVGIAAWGMTLKRTEKGLEVSRSGRTLGWDLEGLRPGSVHWAVGVPKLVVRGVGESGNELCRMLDLPKGP